MAKLHYIGKEDALVNYSCNSSIEELCGWFNKQDKIQFDTETNVCSSIVDRELRVVQVGSFDGSEIWVIQWSFLNDIQKSEVLKLLNNKDILKIIHNASFDYQIILKQGIVMENVWDTMVMEQILYAGHDYDLRFFALAEVLKRRYYLDVSKEQQAEFGDDIITDEKLIYAATDVVHLGNLYKDQRKELIAEDLIQLAEPGKPYEVNGIKIPAVTENEVVLAFADIEYNGMGFDPEKWRENIAKAQPIVDKATKELGEILLQEPYKMQCKSLPVKIKIPDPEDPYNSKKKRTFETVALSEKEQFTINWNSGAQTIKVLNYVFPDLKKASTLELKKYLLENDSDAPKLNSKGNPMSAASKEFMAYITDLKENKYSILKLAVLKEWKHLELFLKENFKERLEEEGYYIPAGKICVNWNSHDTKLNIFRWFVPHAETTDADFVEANSHLPFFKAFQQYQFANSLITKYGEKFIQENVDSDGRVRTRFNTILSTGRVSSSGPNCQQIPSSKLPDDRQNDYRSCFNPGYKDWELVGSDYASQELCVIASLSGDPVWLDALNTGKDLHSVAAEVIHGDNWKILAEDNCAFYAVDKEGNPKKSKCKCKGHKRMRQETKCLNFGLAYGLGPQGLAVDLKITEKAAEELMQKYFSSFPRIKGLLDAFGYYGKTHGYIRTPRPMARKRYFPYWKGLDATSSFLLGKIERASKNAPIQGFSADMVKIALCLLRRKINSANIRDKVQMFVQVHDELASICHKSVTKFWAPIVTETMELAAKICLGNELLKTDTEISDLWKK